MNDNGLFDRVYAYMNAMRGHLSPSQNLPMLIAFSKAKKQKLKDENQIYDALVKASYEIAGQNLFEDRHQAVSLYYGMPDEMEWVPLINNYVSMMGKGSELMLVPEPLIKLMEGGFNRDPESVLIVEGEKFIARLQKMIELHPGTHFTITSQLLVSIELLKEMVGHYENVNIVESNVYESGFINEKFDMILSSPAFGGRTLSEDFTFTCRELDMVAFENLLMHLNSEGELIIILPGKVTFAQGRVGTLRNFVQSNYTLKEIDQLPTGIFANTGIQTYLIDVQNTRPTGDDVIVRRYSAGERKNRRDAVEELILEEDTFVMIDELEEMESWSVDRILEQQSEEWQAFNGSAIRKEVLGNVAVIFRGKNVTKKDPNGNIGVINISNIGEYALNKDNLDYIDEEERKVQNYLLQEGDVLLPGRGTAIRVAIFHEEDFSFPCIASSNVIVIRPDDKSLNSIYLKIFLDSPIGSKIISQAQQGTTIMNLSYKDLSDIEVPLPTVEEQKEIATKYEYELRHYQESVKKAEERWNGVLNELQQF